jgi:ELP3 family radical SAM enzyme/protein acetyltransferase
MIHIMCDIEDLGVNYHSMQKINDDNWNAIVSELDNKRGGIKNDNDLVTFRLYIQKKYKVVLSNSNLIKAYHTLGYDHPEFKYVLTKKKNKSNSGVVVITVLTSAHPSYIDDNGIEKKAVFSCAWNCHYCPNEKAHAGNGFVDQPRSYLFNEPAVLRANDNGFDAILQFNARVSTLIDMGHNIDKIELLILGGTWCSYPKQYQDRFITELYYAANIYYDAEKRPMKSLEEEIICNENAKLHIIGLTLETRPDTINIEEIKRFRKFNATRIQLGIQHTDNKVLKKINRGHTIETAYNAIKLLKDNGYKVDIHLMPNLPGSSYEQDIQMLNDALYDDRLQADQLKIYPCAVVPFTKIKEWFDEGIYVPYDDKKLFQLLKDFKMRVQPYKRLNRIIRDIPSTYISGGYTSKSVNMRQLLQSDMQKNGWKCRCIRCREVGDNKVNDSKVEMKKLYYRSSKGDEYFISFETEEYLIGFIRLRINNSPAELLDVLKDAALIRELHVYSNVSCVGEKNEMSMQHKGYGRRLVEEAERIAIHNNMNKIAIISGTGVRNYYRKLGYTLQDTYMVKTLSTKNNMLLYREWYERYRILS